MTPTYGRLAYHAPDAGAGARARGAWLIAAAPYAMIRARRWFNGANTDRGGALTVSDTEDAVRDLETFLHRYPLLMDDKTSGHLTRRLARIRAKAERIREVLAGVECDYRLREPARPPMPFTEEDSPVPFQRQAADLALTSGRTLIGDDLGFGKTYTALLTLNARGSLPALIVCQAHLPEQMASQIEQTLPWMRVHIVRRREFYDLAEAAGGEPDVLIISYAKLATWAIHLAGRVRTVVFDEVQELRCPDSAKYKAAGLVADNADRVFGLSNTPVYNYGNEAFHVLDVISRGCLGTEAEFVREWCTTKSGKTIIREPGAFGAWLRESGLMIARSYEDIGAVGDDGVWRHIPRPATSTVVENVDYDTEVIERAVSDAAEMARLVLSRDPKHHRARFQAAGQLDMQIRQATGIAKALPVAAYVRMLLQTRERVVLFGWHRDVYDLWLDALAEYNPVLYTGSETPKQKLASKAAFMEGRSRVLIISLRSGTGLDGLQGTGCTDVVFGELDWSPQVHKQGIGRVARGLTRTSVVTVHYLISEGGTDPLMEQILAVKRGQSEPIMSTSGDLFEAPPPDPLRVQRIAQMVVDQVGEPSPGAVIAAARRLVREGEPTLDLVVSA